MVSSLDNDILTMTATTPMATPDTIPWFSSMVSTIFVKQPSKAYLNNVMICLNVLFKTVNDVKNVIRIIPGWPCWSGLSAGLKDICSQNEHFHETTFLSD